MITSAP
jgi:hypothetical protein